MRSFFFLILLFCAAGLAIFLYYSKFTKSKSINTAQVINKYDSLAINKAIALKPFISKQNYNANYCFIVNLAVPSNMARFYVYNYQTNTIQYKGLVCHGKGSDGANGFVFKNEIGSNASSKGNYKIGVSYNGSFGKAYKLHGLENSNTNAYNRFVVLHAHDCVPNVLVHTKKICRSDGCPTVAPQFLLQLTKILDTVRKPVILNIDYQK
jgi:hypothetical protein